MRRRFVIHALVFAGAFLLGYIAANRTDSTECVLVVSPPPPTTQRPRRASAVDRAATASQHAASSQSDDQDAHGHVVSSLPSFSRTHVERTSTFTLRSTSTSTTASVQLPLLSTTLPSTTLAPQPTLPGRPNVAFKHSRKSFLARHFRSANAPHETRISSARDERRGSAVSNAADTTGTPSPTLPRASSSFTPTANASRPLFSPDATLAEKFFVVSLERHSSLESLANCVPFELCPGQTHARQGQGLTLAQQRCLRAAKNEGADVVYFFEDDAIFFDDSRALFCNAAFRRALWQQVPGDALALLFGGHRFQGGRGVQSFSFEDRQLRLSTADMSFGTYAFAVPRGAFDALQETWQTSIDSNASFISPDKDLYRCAGRRSYATVPLMAYHPAGHSSTWDGRRSALLHRDPTTRERCDPFDVIGARMKVVKFYLYDDAPFTALWNSCVQSPAALHRAHRAAWHVLQRARSHPWRVFKPSEATLFLVPVVFFGDSWRCANFSTAIKRIASFLHASTLFNANPDAHVLMDTHYFVPKWIRENGVGDVFFRMLRTVTYLYPSLTQNWALTSSSDERRRRIAQRSAPRQVLVPKTTSYDASSASRLRQALPLARRPFDFFFMGNADSRKHFRLRHALAHDASVASERRNWMAFFNTSNMVHLPLCASLPRDLVANASLLRQTESLAALAPHGCRLPADQTASLSPERDLRPVEQLFALGMAASRFNVMIRGDDYSSKRLFDAVMLGTVNIFVGDLVRETALPFQSRVPWYEFSLFVRERDFLQSPARALATAVRSVDDEQLGRMAAAMDLYRRDVVWEDEESRVFEGALLAANSHSSVPTEPLPRCAREFPSAEAVWGNSSSGSE